MLKFHNLPMISPKLYYNIKFGKGENIIQYADRYLNCCINLHYTHIETLHEMVMYFWIVSKTNCDNLNRINKNCNYSHMLYQILLHILS